MALESKRVPQPVRVERARHSALDELALRQRRNPDVAEDRGHLPVRLVVQRFVRRANLDPRAQPLLHRLDPRDERRERRGRRASPLHPRPRHVGAVPLVVAPASTRSDCAAAPEGCFVYVT